MTAPSSGLRANYPELFKPTITAAHAAPILGMSKSSVYKAIDEGTFPFPVLRIGGRIVIPTAPIREALGINNEPAVA